MCESGIQPVLLPTHRTSRRLVMIRLPRLGVRASCIVIAAMFMATGMARAASITTINCSDTSLTALKQAIEDNWHALGGGGFKQDSVFSPSPHADACESMHAVSNTVGNPLECDYVNAYDLLHAYL